MMLPMFAAAGGGGPVSHFSGTISKYVTGAVACTVTATFETDGTVTGSESGPAGTFSNGASGDTWYEPTLAGIGSSYWIRATLTSGSTPSTGTLDTWQQLTSSKSVGYNSGTGGAVSSRGGTVLFEISKTSGGAVVCSGSYVFYVERET